MVSKFIINSFLTLSIPKIELLQQKWARTFTVSCPFVILICNFAHSPIEPICNNTYIFHDYFSVFNFPKYTK